MTYRDMTFAGVFAALMIATTGSARADAIDGAWCSENGQRLAIDGPSVTTTRGLKLSGDYTRHSFSFILPQNEQDAGSPVEMVLQGETRVRVTIGKSAAQIWHRCPPGTS